MEGPASPSPYIKDEPEDLQFTHGAMNHNAFERPQAFGAQSFGSSQPENGNVNPSDLTMSGSYMTNHFGSSNHMSSSFITGNSGITSDELVELGNLDEPDDQPAFANPNGFSHQDTRQGYFQQEPVTAGPGSMAPTSNISAMYSHTPEGAPIQSPFVGAFDYQQFRVQSQGAFPARMSPSTSMQNGFRPKMSAADRHASDTRSPMTPKTPGMGNININTPDSGSFPGQHMMANQMGHRQQKSMSSQWDNTPNSNPSWVDSPMSSPHTGSLHHPQISEVLGSGKAGSLPAKVDGDATGPTGFTTQSQEAKRRRRRESHNLVERRRRDNINERIQDLSRLVPSHRLDDEKVRKHLQNNGGPLSPSIAASGVSPPGAATSLLAGGNGRRAAGTITQGLPLEEKDKGPNKGDILNGAVSWTRDLMWLLHMKMEQENEIREQLHELGGSWLFEMTEDEKRMQTELYDAIQSNGLSSFSYSRTQGTGLRVPKHTTLAGDALPQHNDDSPENLSPSGAVNDALNGQAPSNWLDTASHANADGPDGFGFKDDDEYPMEM